MGVITIVKVVEAVATHYGISADQLRSGRPFRRQRQVARYLAHRLTGRSLSEIGQQIGDVTHTAVFFSVHVIANEEARDAELAATIARLNDQLTGDGA